VKDLLSKLNGPADRRLSMKKGLVAAGTALQARARWPAAYPSLAKNRTMMPESREAPWQF
jgi:hypothetical protein